MYLFSVTEPVDLTVRSFPGSRRGRGLAYVPSLGVETPPTAACEPSTADRMRLSPPLHGRLSGDSLYCAFSRPFLAQLATFSRQVGRPLVRLLSQAQQAAVLAAPGMPVRLGYTSGSDALSLESQLDAMELRAPVRVAVVNPFAFAFGDSVVALGALREASDRLARRVGTVKMDVLQHTDNIATEDLYRQSGFVGEVHRLPAPLSLLARYDAYIDLSVNYVSHGLPWIDELLELMAIDPATVPLERKQNVVPVRQEVMNEVAAHAATLKASGVPLLLFHHRASAAIRSMPEDVVPRVLDSILAHGNWNVATAIPVPFHHPRLVDWSHLSISFEHLACLIAQADIFVSVDTSVYHVAAAMSVPGVVLFSAIDPYFRTTHYPNIHGVLLGGTGNRVLGKGSSEEPADLAYAATLWSELNLEEVLSVLDSQLASSASTVISSARTRTHRRPDNGQSPAEAQKSHAGTQE